MDEDLVVALVREERQLHPRLGTRKLYHLLHAPLEEAGVKVGRDRMFEILRDRQMLVEPLTSDYPHTTQSHHCLTVFKNLIKGGQFQNPNEVWVGDITYLRTEEGFMYLSLLTDMVSRKIVGYHCGDSLEAEGCVRALEKALQEMPQGARPIHHSDRGSQYCCHEYVKLVIDRRMTVSMTEKDHCAENALAERMNGIIKGEYGLGRKFKTKASVLCAVEQAVYLYNTRRPHTALGNRFPDQVHSLAE